MLKFVWNTNQPLMSNLEYFKATTIKWKLHNNGSIRKDKIHLISQLQGIQRSIQNGRDHEGICKLERQLQTNISKILYQEELIWFQ